MASPSFRWAACIPALSRLRAARNVGAEPPSPGDKRGGRGHKGGIAMSSASRSLFLLGSPALLVLLAATCSKDDTAVPEATQAPTITATEAPTPEPTAPGLTSADLKSLPAAVLSAAPGYAQEDATAEQMDATRELFTAEEGFGLLRVEEFGLLRFLNPYVNVDHPFAPLQGGEILVEFGTVASDHAPQLLALMEGIQEAGLTNVSPAFRASYNAVSTEEVDEATDLGDCGWGFKIMTWGGGMSSERGPSVEFPDLPFTSLMFVRSTVLVKIKAYYDADLDPLAVARAADAALVQAVGEAPR